MSAGSARGLRRRGALLGTAAAVALPWAAFGISAQVPRFSSAPVGPGLPAGWRHETLPKVERANAFDVVADEGTSVLRVRSAASASSLVAAVPSGIAAHAQLRWRWKVAKSLAGSDFRIKQGDDYAARLYVLFDLPLERLSLADRLRIQAARSLSGREIPTAAICYVWGHAQPVGSSGWNPYTDRVRMVVVDSGNARAMQWQAVERDLRRDWQEAFSGPMPPVRAVAVGADTDNTGDGVEAWFGDVLLGAA